MMKILLAILFLIPSVGQAAELLIKAVDATNADPEKDKACYKMGDVVVVMPDGHEWGKEEGEPKFHVLKIPGLSVEDAKLKYLQPVYEDQKLNGKIVPVMTSRRLYKVDEAIMSSKVATLSKSDLEAAVMNKTTGEMVQEEQIEQANF